MEKGSLYGDWARLFIPAEDAYHCEVESVLDPGASEVLIGLPIGPCGGVRMADEALYAVRRAHPGARIYANHEHVHNPDITAPHESAGIEFGVRTDRVEADDVYFLSAHGSAPAVREMAERSGATVYDSVCPLVYHTHIEINDAAVNGHAVAYISFGNPTHPEVQAAIGIAERAGTAIYLIKDAIDASAAIEDAHRLGYRGITLVGQTTNNSDEAGSIAEEIGNLEKPSQDFEIEGYNPRDVCKTVRDRQASAALLVDAGIDTLVVVGSVTSKNTHSLIEVAQLRHREIGSDRGLVIVQANSWTGLQDYAESLSGRKVGIISGASAPQANVEGVIDYLNCVRPGQPVGIDSDWDRSFRSVDPALNKVALEHGGDAR